MPSTSVTALRKPLATPAASASNRRDSHAFETDAEFLHSLTKRQREYFIRRETTVQERLQAALRDVSRGLGVISGLKERLIKSLAGRH